MGAVES